MFIHFIVLWYSASRAPVDPSPEFLEMFGWLIIFFGRYLASRKFLGRSWPAYFSGRFLAYFR